jgi:hypothetical protein
MGDPVGVQTLKWKEILKKFYQVFPTDAVEVISIF